MTQQQGGMTSIYHDTTPQSNAAGLPDDTQEGTTGPSNSRQDLLVHATTAGDNRVATASNGHSGTANLSGKGQGKITTGRASKETSTKGKKRQADEDPSRTPLRDRFRTRCVSSPQRLMTATLSSLDEARTQEAEATAAARTMFSPANPTQQPQGPSQVQNPIGLNLPDPMTIRIPRKTKEATREARRIMRTSQGSPSPAAGDAPRVLTTEAVHVEDANMEEAMDLTTIAAHPPIPPPARPPPTVTISPMVTNTVIHGWTRDNVILDVPREIKDIWGREATGIVFIHIYDSYRVNKTKEAAELLQMAVSSILNTNHVRIGAPTGSSDLFVCGGLSENQKRVLMSRTIWSTNLISFDPVPFEPPISSYALSLRGVKIQDNADGEREFAREVRNILENYIGFASYFCAVARFQLKNQRTRTMEAIRSNTLHSMVTKAVRLPMSDGNTDLIWNVYMDSPSDHPGEHKVWIAMLKSARWYIKLNEAEVVEFRCHRCRSLDHPASDPKTHTYQPGKTSRLNKEYMAPPTEAEAALQREERPEGAEVQEVEAGEAQEAYKGTTPQTNTRPGAGGDEEVEAGLEVGDEEHASTHEQAT
ncbi:hypothetical protein H0H93_012595 [Arthromyces matolae]|nr:hypothetical protein H0H93_012595 [Arthromyces matolae]